MFVVLKNPSLQLSCSSCKWELGDGIWVQHGSEQIRHMHRTGFSCQFRVFPVFSLSKRERFIPYVVYWWVYTHHYTFGKTAFHVAEPWRVDKRRGCTNIRTPTPTFYYGKWWQGTRRGRGESMLDITCDVTYICIFLLLVPYGILYNDSPFNKWLQWSYNKGWGRESQVPFKTSLKKIW